MVLSQIVESLGETRVLDSGDPEISDVCVDSRQAGSGSLFCAIKGEKVEGASYLGAAAERGAVACLVEEQAPSHDMVRVLCPDVEEAAGRAAATLLGDPSKRVKLIGITGTNGKTTTSILLQHILRDQGLRTGRIGTVGYAFPSGRTFDAPLTTPDGPTLQKLLADMVTDDAEAVVAEVSSHALDRKRVAGCEFACAAFLNLTQDHLDYHGTMEEYFEAKKLLFTRYATDCPVPVNIDDPWGRKLADELGARALTFGLAMGDLKVEIEELGSGSAKGRVKYPGGVAQLDLPLAGEFNALNAAAALAICLGLELNVDKAVKSLATAPAAPGRLEPIPNQLGIGVYVDYAHTPDALDRVLDVVERITPGKLVCVFGCGGDRDRAKRPLMGKSGADHCATLVITADNSRSEPTERIIADIREGIPAGWRKIAPEDEPVNVPCWVEIADRGAAIDWAVRVAAPGDSVVVAGKGHETTQTEGGRTIPFDDRVAARRALERRAAG